jgi:hypothetical protein
MMKDITHSLLDSLQSFEWFCNVGKPVSGAICVPTWDQVAELVKSDRADEIMSDMANLGRYNVRKVSVERYNDWNEIPRVVCPKLTPLVLDAIGKNGISSHPDRESIATWMDWHLIGWLVEVEYSDLVAPGYFCRMGKLFKEGHFPCGWHGNYWPEGMPIVY